MSVTVRIAKEEDFEEMLEVECKVFPDFRYLNDVKENYLDPAKGTLLLSEEDGKITGICHLGFLADNSGWMECLRVDPSCQKHGAGTKMWDYAVKICEENKLSALRMYTGLTNETSKKLGERNGLSVKLKTQEGNLLSSNIPSVPEVSFNLVKDKEEAKKLISKYSEGFEGYICFNRTYVPLNDSVISFLVDRNFVYSDGENVLVLGYRFMEKEALHLGFTGGDSLKCMHFAINEFKKSGLPKLTFMVPEKRDDLKDMMTGLGFDVAKSVIIMLERIF